jgi:hypothetical protein
VHSPQPPQSPLQEIFGRAQHTLPPSTNHHMIQCHLTEITTTNQETLIKIIMKNGYKPYQNMTKK